MPQFIVTTRIRASMFIRYELPEFDRKGPLNPEVEDACARALELALRQLEMCHGGFFVLGEMHASARVSAATDKLAREAIKERIFKTDEAHTLGHPDHGFVLQGVRGPWARPAK